MLRRIIPGIYPQRSTPTSTSPDAQHHRRLARRISERNVQRGLRTTLLTQAKRLERLANERLKDFPKDAEEEADT
jgi:hypothetical protein